MHLAVGRPALAAPPACRTAAGGAGGPFGRHAHTRYSGNGIGVDAQGKEADPVWRGRAPGAAAAP